MGAEVGAGTEGVTMGRLLLTRHVGERLVIRTGGGDVWVTVVETHRGEVRLAIHAPPEMSILREELVAKEEGGDGPVA